MKSQVLWAANNLSQGSQECLRGANNLRQKRKKMFHLHLFYIVLMQIILNSGEKIVSTATILSQQKSQKDI